MRHYIVIFLLSFLVFGATNAQQVPAVVYYNNLAAGITFPNKLQSSRSVVIVDIAEDWQKFSRTVHKKLRLMSIDPVLYIDIKDITSGVDASKAILKHLENRKIDYVLTFSKNSNNQYEVNITGAKNFLQVANPSHKSARFSHLDLQSLLKFMANELIKAELTKKNFLISETPEFLTDVKMLENRKFEVHARDVNRLKLAVPKFELIDEQAIGSLQNKQAAENYNVKAKRWNKELEIILREFPYEYEFVETTDSNELFRKGFQYALFHINTKGIVIKRMLDLKMEEAETEYISYTENNVLKRINVNTPVSKFYVKQVVTNDVYTGDKWDADTTWQSALKNYIFNFRKFVKK